MVVDCPNGKDNKNIGMRASDEETNDETAHWHPEIFAKKSGV